MRFHVFKTGPLLILALLLSSTFDAQALTCTFDLRSLQTGLPIEEATFIGQVRTQIDNDYYSDSWNDFVAVPLVGQPGVYQFTLSEDAFWNPSIDYPVWINAPGTCGGGPLVINSAACQAGGPVFLAMAPGGPVGGGGVAPCGPVSPLPEFTVTPESPAANWPKPPTANGPPPGALSTTKVPLIRKDMTPAEQIEVLGKSAQATAEILGQLGLTSDQICDGACGPGYSCKTVYFRVEPVGANDFCIAGTRGTAETGSTHAVYATKLNDDPAPTKCKVTKPICGCVPSS
jgi:hypothetical protein